MTPEHDPVSLGSNRNVTAQGEEAEALRRERDLLSAVLDTAGALAVVLDRQGRIIRFNCACETATGYSFAEVRGRALWDLFLVPEEVPPVRAAFEQLRTGQFPNRHENHWLTKGRPPADRLAQDGTLGRRRHRPIGHRHRHRRPGPQAGRGPNGEASGKLLDLLSAVVQGGA